MFQYYSSININLSIEANEETLSKRYPVEIIEAALSLANPSCFFKQRKH
jgi:hypothetical protein